MRPHLFRRHDGWPTFLTQFHAIFCAIRVVRWQTSCFGQPMGLFDGDASSLTPTGVKGSSMSGINDYIDNEVKGNDVVLFMKGTPGFPQCGFSGQVVQILDYIGADYKGVNVLDSAELRQGIKEYSNWPTIPQLYVKGEFVGGCDIIREMFQAGELQTFLVEKGVSVKATA
jgi:monothiol glutaredoxin